MANDPAFLFYPGDYLRDTQCLSEKSQVAYDRIMCEHMRQNSKIICKSYEDHMQIIAISQEQLNFFIKRLNEDEKKEIFLILKKVKAGFQIEWVAESIYKRRTYSESRRKNKEGKTKNISKSHDSHMENAIIIENEIKNKKENFPKIETVARVFAQQGGTPEMATAFFNRYESVNWKIRGSPVMDFAPLVGNFIVNWNKNQTNGHKSASNSNGASARDKQTAANQNLIRKLRTITGTG